MFITNNYTLLHLWWKKDLVIKKPQNILTMIVDIDKLETIPVDQSTLSDVGKMKIMLLMLLS